jgi:WD40 repeat protein
MRKYFYQGPDDFKLLSQNSIRCHLFDQEPNNSIWDSTLCRKDGKLYLSLSSELNLCGYARLYEFDYMTNSSRKLLAVEDIILPQDRAIRASKFHTSISFINDDQMVMTTHSTDKPPQHPTWLIESFFGNAWEGFAGSSIVTYNRKTGEAKNLGTPAPKESLYGSIYDPAHQALYSMGYMKGHLYRYSFRDKTVKDFGKVSEAGSFRMVMGPDGNIYSASKSGYMFMINTKEERIVDLNYRVPFFSYGENYTFPASFGNISAGRIGPDGRIYFSIMYGPDIIALDTKSGEIENMGAYLPTPRYAVTENRNGIFGFDFDSKGVMWYCVTSVSDGSSPEQPAQPASLFRWDILRGGRPEWAGIVGTHERVAYVHSELFIHDNTLLIVETNHADEPAAVFTINLDKLEPKINDMEPVDPAQLKDNMFIPGHPATFGYSRLFDYQAGISEKNPYYFDGDLYAAHRIWRALAPDHIDNSAVKGIAWAEDGSLHGLCGQEKTFAFKIQNNEIAYVKPLDELSEKERKWLNTQIVAQPDEPVAALPYYPGRQFKAKPTASVALSDNRKLVGTLDGLIAICSENQTYSLGMAGYNGPVRAMCTTPDRKTAFGVAGDDEDLGMVFSFDDKNGLRLRGCIKHGSSKFPAGVIACNILSCCQVSPDGQYLAIGSADRLGTVVVYKL